MSIHYVGTYLYIVYSIQNKKRMSSIHDEEVLYVKSIS